jgi:hypothetical protein
MKEASLSFFNKCFIRSTLKSIVKMKTSLTNQQTPDLKNPCLSVTQRGILIKKRNERR